MDQGEKLINLIGQLGLKQNVVARNIGYHPVTLSKKAKDGSKFPKAMLEKLSIELGITVDYLADTSRPYYEGDTIPEDAIRSKTPPAKPAPDTNPVAALMILAQKQMQETRSELAQIDPEIILQANREMIEAMNRLSAQMQELSQELRLNREGEPGEHDPD